MHTHPIPVIQQPVVDHYERHHVFQWNEPNWGWFFLGAIAGFFLFAICRRIGGLGS